MNSRHLRSEIFSPNTGHTSFPVGTSLWLMCRADGCKLRRPIFGKARAQYDAMDAAQQKLVESSFTCAWVEDASFENSCVVPAVFAQGYDWWYDVNGEKSFAKLGGKVVDQTRLFFFAQACDGELSECYHAAIKQPGQLRNVSATKAVEKIWEAIAWQLGLSGLGKHLEDVYRTMFKVSQTSGGLDDFESVLRGRIATKIEEMRAEMRAQILPDLSIALGLARGGKQRGAVSEPSVQSTVVQPQRVRLYEVPSAEPARTGKLLALIKTVNAASTLLSDEKKAVGLIHPRTRDIFKKLAEATSFSTAGDNSSRRTLPFIADTRT